MKLSTVIFEKQQMVVLEEADFFVPLVNPETGKIFSEMAAFIGYYSEMGEGNLENYIWKQKKAPRIQAVLLSPIVQPRRDIICLGLNYQEHVAEGERFFQEKRQKKAATYFSKRVNRCVAPGGYIALHSDITAQLDYECELGVVIGKTCRNIKKGEAYAHIFGYTIINDITARDLQKKHGQWFLGKGLDDCTAMGPCIVTKDEIAYPPRLNIGTKINGVIRQESNTDFMIHGIDEVIEELSSAMTLFPGDVIATGTPAGVGFGFDPPRFLKDGDVVECSIEKIGVLANTIKG